MVHRGIATLALALIVCFLALSHFDQQFFFLHFYESLIYIVIVLMLFYLEDRWAYMLGMLAPAGWLIMTFATGGFGEFFRQTNDVVHSQPLLYPPALLGAITSMLSVAMIGFCGYRWRREFTGLGKGLSSFLVSFGIVAVYYGVLIFWFWHAAAA